MEPTRRNVAKGVAWSIPAITVSAAAPAVASSPSTTPCGSPKSPAVQSRTYNTTVSSKNSQSFSGIYNTCNNTVPPGISFRVSWCNTGTQSTTISNTYTHQGVSLVSGVENSRTLAPGACATWDYITTATLPATQGISVNIGLTRPATVTASVTVTGMPAGYNNTDPNNGASSTVISV